MLARKSLSKRPRAMATSPAIWNPSAPAEVSLTEMPLPVVLSDAVRFAMREAASSKAPCAGGDTIAWVTYGAHKSAMPGCGLTAWCVLPVCAD